MTGQTVRIGTLVEFDFLSGTERYWTGMRTITAGGQTWTGGGILTAVSEISLGPGLRSDPVTFTFSGLSAAIEGKAFAQSSQVYGREVQVFGQVFDANWQPLDSPWNRFWGEMDTMTETIEGEISTIELRAEDIALDKSRAPNGLFSHRDQVQRHATDKGLIRVAISATNTFSMNWP